MSATGRKGSKREPNDFYETPSWCIDRFLEHVGNRLAGTNWLEASAGSGAIIKAVNRFYPDISFIATELQAKFKTPLESCPSVSKVIITNYLEWEPKEKFDVSIGNPPYKLAKEVIIHSIKHSRQVCMLLRLNFLSSQKRFSWMKKTRPDVFVLPNRPSFTGNGTDATDYAWFLWDENSNGKLEFLKPTPINERKKK